jgi:hypothetical protein
MADFCTVQDVEEFLQLDISSDADKLASCERAIGAATEAIRNYCNQHIDLVTDDVYTFDVAPGRWNLLLPEMPVVSVSEVVEDGVTLVVGDEYKLANFGQLLRVGRRWMAGIQIVAVTYTHGYDAYDSLPADIVDVCTRAASRAYQAGLRSDDSDGVPGVSAKSLGDYSVSFGAEGGGGISEGILGASASRALLLSEKDLLDKYRLRGC